MGNVVIAEPPRTFSRILLLLRAIVHSLMVQLPILWLFFVHCILLLLQYFFVLPVFHVTPSDVINARAIIDEVIAGLIVAGFLLDLFTQGFMQFFSQPGMWLELLVLLPAAVVAVLLDTVISQDLPWLGWLFLADSICVLIGLCARFYWAVSGRLYFAPLAREDRAQLKSVNFIWVNRTMDDVLWLVDELRELENKDTLGLLNIQLHITADMTTMPSLGLRHAIRPGRPEWHYDLLELSRSLPKGAVMGVQFCGPPAMARAVRNAAATATALSMEVDEDTRTIVARTRFLFRKENF